MKMPFGYILIFDGSNFQIVSVLLATSGAVLSIKNFENSFSNTHQRIGLVLYALIWIQPLIGFCRPDRYIRTSNFRRFILWVSSIRES